VDPEYVQQHFSAGKLFTVDEEKVSDLYILSNILQKLEKTIHSINSNVKSGYILATTL